MSFLGYIDPGSGLFVWQMVVAACVGSLFYVKKCRNYIINKLKKLFGCE